jgi:hypothetical protein
VRRRKTEGVENDRALTVAFFDRAKFDSRRGTDGRFGGDGERHKWDEIGSWKESQLELSNLSVFGVKFSAQKCHLLGDT